MGLVVDYGGHILGAVVLALLVGLVARPRQAIRRNGEPLRTPPDTLPLVGNGIKFLQSRWDLLGWFDKCQRQFGYETVALTVPTLPPGVLIHSPQNLEYVFKNEGLFTKGEFVKRRSWDLFGNGIINADGDMWKLQRKAGLAFLNNANLRVLTDVALPQYLSETLRDLKTSIGGDIVDLQHVFHEITTKLMGQMAYNMEMHADDAFSQAFDYASGATAERFQNPLWPVTELLTGRKFRRSVATVKSFGQRIVASAMHDRAAQQQTPSPSSFTPTTSDEEEAEDLPKPTHISGSLIQSLLAALSTPSTVADAALTYLSAGRDTTGQALTWTFYLLLQHPGAISKIRAEVASLLASHPSDSPLNTTLFTPLALPYTTAVFHEALRLYPPIPFEIRQCQADAVLPDGTALPRGSVLVWCIWAMQRSALTWGGDAGLFRPERFLREDKNGRRFVLGKSASEFPVFYGGARTCLGRRMAEAVAVQVIPAVVWGVELEAAWEVGVGRRSQTSLTLPMEGGLPVRVVGRG
ncbi:cytochrome P450 [Staphylotrichum tortipilum]|uniref:Cytochrome P450 n=1 Tax=Staphylotrichum tortipilum TaxID=2831512 RepID=A0AAN6MFA4_9PEZI|nr:cytochrome P450 [Staphylotrichum longicolle]